MKSAFKPFKAAAKGKKKNFYAVRKGVKPGIYLTYAECQKHIKGFSRAEFKGFATKLEAEKYIAEGKAQDDIRESVPIDAIHVYTDGSLLPETGVMGAGMYAVMPNGQEARMFARLTSDLANDADKHLKTDMDRGTITPSSSMAELFAVWLSIKRLRGIGYNKIIIHADNDGVRNWFTGTWAAKKPAIKYLTEAIKREAGQCQYFSIAAVDGHSGDVGNEEADRLAGIGSSGGQDMEDRGMQGVIQFSKI